MRALWVLVVVCLWPSLAHAGAPSSEQLRAKLQETQRVLALKDPPVACTKLNALWFELPSKLDGADPLFETWISIRARLYERRRVVRCLTTGRPETAPPTPTDEFSNYQALLKRVEGRRPSCPVREKCPDLQLQEAELGRQAAHLLRVLPPASKETLEIEQSLSVVFGAGLDNQSLIQLLQGRRLSDDERRLLDDQLLAQDPRAAANVLGLLKALRDKPLAEADAAELVQAASALLSKGRYDAARLARLTKILVLLNDPEQSTKLTRMLALITQRYEVLAPQAQAAAKELAKAQPEAKVIADFFNSIDPVVLAQVERDVNAASSSRRAPVAPNAYAAASSPLFFHVDEGLKASCPALNAESGEISAFPGQQFLLKIVTTLNYRGGPKSGIRPLVEVQDSAAFTTLRDNMAQVVKQGTRAEACQHARVTGTSDYRPPYEQVCVPPFPAVLMFELKPAADLDGLEVEGWWWSDTESARHQLPSMKPMASCGRDEGTQGFIAAGAIASRISVFKLTPPEDAPQPPRVVVSRGSPWLAAPFAGAPYLVDSRSAAWPKWAFSIVDGSLMAGAVTASALSVQYRNDYANGSKSSLTPANQALDTALIFAGGAIVTRLVSGAVFELLPSAWQKKNQEQR